MNNIPLIDQSIDAAISAAIIILFKSIKEGKAVHEYKLWDTLNPKARQMAILYLAEIKAAVKEDFPPQQLRSYLFALEDKN